ncbi:putative ribose-5-phosphate isomerase 3 [Hibiscus syriacus]|uniref:Ribose-5-phosphate isomerase 3 n=1 Tax=Hibiscus syriacus TaxID=106335 RepID=A0A6A3B4P6_HIBSY|nr:putative ribose-5-phosphate isomerase 3 [Hibiscus syriacus]
MVEAASSSFIVVADDSKLVSGLGGSGLAMPVEVVHEVEVSSDGSEKPYVTDNGNYIVDLYFKNPIKDGFAAGKEISSMEGVVEHGLFLGMATSVIIAGKTGVEVMTK